MKNLLALALILMVAISGIVLIQSYKQMVGLYTYSTLAVSQVYVEGGTEKDGKWIQGYWVILCTTSSYGKHIFYKFDKEEAQKWGATETSTGIQIEPKSSVEILITVGQPYVSAKLQTRTYQICPKTYGYHRYTTGSDAWYEEHLEWDEQQQKWVKKSTPMEEITVNAKETVSTWMVHVPLEISAKKIDSSGTVTQLTSNGKALLKLDVTGEQALIPITFENPENPEEKLTIKLEGLLSTGYVLDLPQLIIFRDDYIFEKTDELKRVIDFYWQQKPDKVGKETYAYYWFNTGIRGHTEDDGQTCYVHEAYAEEGEAKGIQSYSTISDMWYIPYQIYVWRNPPPINGKQYMGVMSYLASKFERPNLDIAGCGYKILDDEVKIYLPYRSYNWLYTIQISTELVDTYVIRESLAKAKITEAKWTSTGTSTVEIADKETLEVTVKNEGQEGNIQLIFEKKPSDAPIEIRSTGTFLRKDETKTLTVTVTNLGVTEKYSGELVIKAVNDKGETTDTYTVKFVLLPTTGRTSLVVKVLEEGTNRKVGGLYVIVKWADTSKGDYTVDGVVSFNLGTWQGKVLIVTEETLLYESATKETTVELGTNEVTIHVKPKTETPLTSLPVNLVAIMFGIIAVTAIVIFILVKSRKGVKK